MSDIKNNEEPWYRKSSIIISLIALIFSFGTTLFSVYNSHQEDMRANRRDVRSLLQRLSRLPIENYDLMQKNKGTGQGEMLSGMINQENILLSIQAAELIERYPAAFTSTEYYAVASGLSNSNIISKVPSFFNKAMELASSSNDYNVAARSYGGYLYSKGEYTEGRRLFLAAINTWDKFPEKNSYVVNSTDLVTFMFWSQAEHLAGNKTEAQAKLVEAKRKLTMLSPGSFTEALKNQIDYSERLIN
jgi:hypothetical protein